ncbi:acyl carrier protein [Kitasatospora sp. NPDC058218]|uniref:acyl carrier protein n=1 Tax=Kitasatospora sp. NPDC058218 TaxID=3346385 RepID=UPI0036D78873
MYDTLTHLLTEELGLDPADVRPDATFRDLRLDSLTLAELAILVEESTGHAVSLMGPDTTLAQAAERYVAAPTPRQAT